MKTCKYSISCLEKKDKNNMYGIEGQQMHKMSIRNGTIFFYKKELRGVSRYKIKGSAKNGRIAELVIQMDVILEEIESELKK